jgi:hypothetical protein
MEFILKVDDNQQAVLNDGKPVYIMKDGEKEEEFIADVPSMYGKTIELKGENKNFRTQLKTAKDALGVFTVLFDGVENVAEYKTTADAALATMKNLDDKQLVDAGKVEQIKTELQTAHDTNMGNAKTKFKEEQDVMTIKLGGKDKTIRRLTVGNHFAKDPHFSGKEPKTNVQPAMAEAYWGHLYTVDEAKLDLNGMPRVVGHHPVTGDEILSRKPDTVGEIAEFGEAMEVIIETSPLKASITETLQGGSGAGGGQGGGGGGGDELTELQAKHAEAVKAGDGRQAVILKNQIFKLQQGLRPAGQARA